jgi:uncharacterized membrane protein YedE/YeeE
LLFGLGLMLSGMSNPGEVLSFLDWSGVWSPDLMGVLGSAVLVSVIGFQLARRRRRPWFEDEFPALPKKPIDRSQLIGNLLSTTQCAEDVRLKVSTRLANAL